MRKKAMVFGATGYTGREVVRLLGEQGLDVVAHIRPDSGRFDAWRERFEAQGATVDKSAWEQAALVETLRLRSPDLLFCLIGTTKARERASGGESSYEAIDYGLTKLLVDACGEAGVSPRFVYLSAMGTGPGARGAYYRARWKAEVAVRESGLDFVIARPGVITGAGREEARPLERIGGVAADVFAGGLKILGARRLASRYRSVDNVELASALVKGVLSVEESEVVLESEVLNSGDL